MGVSNLEKVQPPIDPKDVTSIPSERSKGTGSKVKKTGEKKTKSTRTSELSNNHVSSALPMVTNQIQPMPAYSEKLKIDNQVLIALFKKEAKRDEKIKINKI